MNKIYYHVKTAIECNELNVKLLYGWELRAVQHIFRNKCEIILLS